MDPQPLAHQSSHSDWSASGIGKGIALRLRKKELMCVAGIELRRSKSNCPGNRKSGEEKSWLFSRCTKK